MMVYVLLYTSLLLFAFGMVYRLYSWFSRRIGFRAHDFKTFERMAAVAGSVAGVVFSPKIFLLIKSFLLDVVFQRRILKENFFRWAAHMLIFAGFMLLLLMHALETVVSEPLFEGYHSRQNPYLFLRDLCGFMVLIGLAMALYRRYVRKVPRLKTNGMDLYAIVILSAVMLSGILLEGLKISSYSEFQVMVEDYADVDDESKIKALESLWVQDLGLVSPNVKGPFAPEVIDNGRELHDASCSECHASNKWAFTGYATAKMIRPAALALDRANAAVAMWYIHILACFAGLAYLPFSKMLHILSTPISLLTNAVAGDGKTRRVTAVTRQAVEVDACVHCGTCSLYCSAMMAFDAKGNEYILPSEKMVFLKRLGAGKTLSQAELIAIQEGVYLCTNCDRCTVVCPSGIRLKELWTSVREDLVQKGAPEPLMLSPLSVARSLSREDTDFYKKPLERVRRAVAGDFDEQMDRAGILSLNPPSRKPLSVDPTFSSCFGCQSCTSVCPVVGNYDNPEEALGLLPHQIMCTLALGQADMASGARMIWDCVTCYQCQEHCPQKVNVADLLFELKNLAVGKMRKELKQNIT